VEFFGSSRSWSIDVDDPPPPTCPNDPLVTPSDRWKLEIWSNQDLAGTAIEQRYDAAGAGGFAFDWGNGGPSSCGTSDHFGVRFSRRVNLPDSTTYTFTTTTDDGVRLWVDGELVIDRWQNQARTSYTASRALSAGPHDLRMDHFDNTGQAYAGLSWVANVPQGSCPPGAIDLADYLLGSPEVRIHIRHDHGGEEHFAYRAGGTVDGLDQHFLVKSLDGVSWEEFGVDDEFMYRHRDTSWSQTCDLNGTQVPAYYLLRDADRDRFARLAPRCMTVGQSWGSPVQAYVDGGYRAPDRCDLGCQTQYSEAWIDLVATLVDRHEQFTTTQGLAIHDLPGQPDVIEFITGPFNDHFWLARGIGMIQFEGPN
ncbi:MAG: PA14 domain-containing protein, partial [Actinomycetota bacterium]